MEIRLIRSSNLSALYCFAVIFMCARSIAERFGLSVLETASPAPSLRYSSAVYSFPGSNTVILFGGRTKTRSLGDTWFYDARAQNWSLVRKTGPSARYDCLFVGLDFGGARGRFVYLIGGRNGKGVLKTSFFWGFHVYTKTWTLVTIEGLNRDDPYGLKAIARFGAVGGVTSNKKILISHGKNNDHIMADTYEITMLSPFEAKVSRRLHQSISTYRIGRPRPTMYSAGIVTTGNDLVLVGGCYDLGLCPNQDAWAFRKDWKLLSKGPSARQYASMVLALPVANFTKNPQHSVVLYGGLESSKQTAFVEKSSPLEIDVLDVSENRWTREFAHGPTSADIKRYGSSMVMVGTGSEDDPFRYFIFGGISDKGNLSKVNLELTFDPQGIPHRTGSTARLYSHLHTHGILMFMSFGLLTPIGSILTRYTRTFPSLMWFRVHVTVSCSSGVLAWIGMIFAIKCTSNTPNHTHGILGITLMVIITLQLAASIPGIRPNPNSGTPRLVWDRFHTGAGWLSVFLGLINVFLGFVLLMMPSKIWISFITGVSALIVLTLIVEARRRLRRDHKDERYILSSLRAGQERSEETPSSCDGLTSGPLAY